MLQSSQWRASEALGQRAGRRGLHRCRATAIGTAVKHPQPFGGAIVSKLAGSTKVVKGDSHLLQLLGPGNGPQPHLPFMASVECARNGVLHRSPSPGGAAAALSGIRVASGTKSGSASASFDDGTPRMLDVLYALSGTGVVATADGTVRRLSAGDSMVAWHNTTELRSVPGEQPPVVLTFHFPASVLMLPPGAVVAPAPSHADLQVMVDECQGQHEGELSLQEADDMLRGVQQRAARAISTLYGSTEQQHSAPESAASPAAAAATAGAYEAAGSPSSSAPASVSASTASNNAVAVPPLLRRMLRSTSGAALPEQPQESTPSFALASASSLHAGLSASPSHAGLSAAASYAAAEHLTGPSPAGCVLLQRALEDFKAFRFPRQTNKLAFVFDPSELGLSLSFGVEVFEPGHHTPLHIHKNAHELFFVLAGEGVAFCNGEHFAVRAGDVVVFPPLAVHGIDNNADQKLYCLQLMTPNEAFVEHVKSGEAMGRLDDEDICNLASRHC